MRASTPLSVIVIEHREEVRTSLCELLQSLGHVARGASDIESALAVATEGCDLVLCDANMPPAGGMPILAALREVHPKLLGVIMSGGELEGLEEEGLWEPPLPFIPKPIGLDTLRRVISRAESSRMSA